MTLVRPRGEAHNILSAEELRALTEGLAVGEKAVLIVSPFVGDLELLGRTLEAKNVRVVALLGMAGIARALDEEDFAAAIVSGTVFRQGGIVELIRGRAPDLPIFAILDDLNEEPPEIPPPSGVWLRERLLDLVAAHFGRPEAEAAPGRGGLAEAVRGGDATEVPRALLERLCEPASSARAFLSSVLEVAGEAYSPAALAGLVWSGEFVLEVSADLATARERAGRWILREAARLWTLAAPKRIGVAEEGGREAACGLDFAAVDAVPLRWGEQVLGTLLFFWTGEARASPGDRLGRLVASRLWELLGRSGKGLRCVPFEAFVEAIDRGRDEKAILVIAAPVAEARLEAFLVEGEMWAREPGGAVAFTLARQVAGSGDVPRILAQGLGEAAAGLFSPAREVNDAATWIGQHSRSLALLRQSAVTGFLPASGSQAR